MKSLDRALKSLNKKHYQIGVTWICHVYDVVYFHSFNRDKRFTTAGIGKKCLTEILGLTDQAMMSVELFTSVPKLEEMYKSFGFTVVNKYPHKTTMIRFYGWENRSIS